MQRASALVEEHRERSCEVNRERQTGPVGDAS